jgi:AraC-like DNA-binding protein
MPIVRSQHAFEGLTLKCETYAWAAGEVFSYTASRFNLQQAGIRRPVRARLVQPAGTRARLGSLVLMPADCVMAVEGIGTETGFPVRTFELDTDWLVGLAGPDIAVPLTRVAPQPIFDDPQIAQTLDRIATELQTPLAHSPEMLRCLIRTLAIHTVRSVAARTRQTRAIGTLTNDQLALLEWSLETSDFAEVSPARLARDCGMSVARLRQAYHLTTGQSLRDRIESARQARACHDLTATDDPLKVIAYRTGFTHPSAFCYWFKRSTGQTPTEYRTRHDAGIGTKGFVPDKLRHPATSRPN